MSFSNSTNSTQVDVEGGKVNPAFNDKLEEYEKPEALEPTYTLEDRKDSLGSYLPMPNRDPLAKAIVKLRNAFTSASKNHTHIFKIIVITAIFATYNGYFAWVLGYNIHNDIHWEWCDGQGFLIIITAIVYFFLFYYHVIKRFFWKTLTRRVILPLNNLYDRLWEYRIVRYLVYAVIVGAIVAYLVVDTKDERGRLRSVLGVAVLVILGYVFSAHPDYVCWRHVFWGLGLQFVFGLFILRWDVGADIFDCLGHKVDIFLNYTTAGSSFVYGDTLINENVFYFKTLSVIYFFSFFISTLYYWGAMQWIVEKIGWLLFKTVGTTACESMNASANIFVGQTEAPLLIRPFLPVMTKSEIHAVMTGGFATISGSVLAAYISFGVSPSHLLSASVMSAPAALGYAKLMYPETEKSKTSFKDLVVEKGDEVNALDAASRGASTAIMLVLNIGAQLIAFMAGIEFLNNVTEWLFLLVGIEDITFVRILSYIFYPIAWIMGVPGEECLIVGKLMGLKTIINEFVAYEQLGKYMEAGTLSNRATILSTYALCGFSNFASIGIQIGGLSAMAPSRKGDLAKVAFRSCIAGNAACILTACIAGTLLSDIDASSPL